MSPDELKQLEEFFRRNPEFQKYLRLSPPLARFGQTWRRIREVRSLGYSLELMDHRGQRLRLPKDFQEREAFEREAVLLRKVVGTAFPGRRLRRVGTPGATASRRIVRFLAIRDPADRVAVIAATRGGAIQPTELLSRLVLWWSRLAQATRAAIFLPRVWGDTITQFLGRLTFPVFCYQYSERGDARRIYPRDRTETETRSPYVIFPLEGQVPDSLREIHSCHPDLDLAYRSDHWELAYLGFPVLWTAESGRLQFDRFHPRTVSGCSWPDWLIHLDLVRRLRVFPPLYPSSPYYRFSKERWMESLVLRNLKLISPDFGDVFYCQVPTYVEGERKVLDLLTATREGRIAVLELKPEKDPGLLFQGLEYWERVRTHILNGDLASAGFFPDMRCSHEAPLLYLISPLFEFHRSMPVMRNYLGQDVRFECVGINGNWRKRLRVLRRFRI